MGANSKEYQAAYRARLAERGYDTPASKLCSKCGETKPAGDFYASSGSPDGLQSYCKACVKSRVRAPRPKTPEQVDRYLQKEYGITLAEREQMKVDQGGVCAVCAEVPDRWVVDHCHDTGKVRGLLCDTCNRALGLLRDKVEVLMSAATYLMANEDVLSKVGE